MTTLPVKHKLLVVQSPYSPDDRPEAIFARRVREIREKQGMTQAALALLMEVKGIRLDSTAITKLEKGTRTIRLDEAVAIAASLDMTVDELLRAALPVTEQLEQAEAAIEPAKWRYATADAELVVAVARRDRLRARLAEQDPEGGDDDGQHQEAP